MDAFMRVRMCKNAANDLFKETGTIPVLKLNGRYNNFDSGKLMCYVHPEDKDKEYFEDFKYPFREL